MQVATTSAAVPSRLLKASAWVLLAGLAITGLVFRWARRDGIDQDTKRFQSAVEQYRQEFETRAERYELGLENMADWIASVETPTLTQWQNRMERTSLRVNYPGVTELAFAPAFFPDSRNRALWQNAHPDHWPPPGEWEDAAFQVWYQATQGPAIPGEWGRRLYGLMNFSSNQHSFFHATGVRSTGRIMASNAGSGQPLAAFIFIIAAFRNDLPRPIKPGEKYRPDEDLGAYTAERGSQRRMGTIGLLAATVCMDPFLEAIFGSRPLEIDVDIYAGAVAETNRMTRLDRPRLTQAGQAFYQDLEIAWYQNRWHIVAVPNARFFRNSRQSRAWVMGWCGFGLTLSVYLALRVQERSRASAEAWANSLEIAREELREAHKSRVRFERDLHDGVLQSIYASVLGLRRAARLITREPAKALPIVTDVGNELDAAMTDIRHHLSSRPSEGISPAQFPEMVAGLAHAYNRIGQSQVDLDLDLMAVNSLDHEQSEQVFHCVREAVTNAHRHGAAQRIQIRVEKSANGVDVLIEDNGSGFDPRGAATPGRGLNHIRQRAELCGGLLELSTRRGGPTLVRIKLPILGAVA